MFLTNSSHRSNLIDVFEDFNNYFRYPKYHLPNIDIEESEVPLKRLDDIGSWRGRSAGFGG